MNIWINKEALRKARIDFNFVLLSKFNLNFEDIIFKLYVQATFQIYIRKISNCNCKQYKRNPVIKGCLKNWYVRLFKKLKSTNVTFMWDSPQQRKINYPPISRQDAINEILLYSRISDLIGVCINFSLQCNTWEFFRRPKVSEWSNWLLSIYFTSQSNFRIARIYTIEGEQ